jgi:outer membrane protein OmpA-like peptidoglycan-associated protein
MKTSIFFYLLLVSVPIVAQDAYLEGDFQTTNQGYSSKSKPNLGKSSHEKKGDEMYDYYNYSKAIYYYEQADSLQTSGLRKMADSYAKLQSYDQSLNTYKLLVNRTDCSASDLFNYANMLKMNGSYEEADYWMLRYVEKAPEEKRASLNASSNETTASLIKDDRIFELTNCGMNTPKQEFASGMYMDQLVYSASSPKRKLIKKEYMATGEPFLDLFIADVDGDSVQSYKEFFPAFNKKYHEGPLTFSGDYTKVFFTSNDRTGKKAKDGLINLQLYYSEKDLDGEWTEVVPFKYNNADYSFGHPSLSADGKTLFFSSNMPGGYGGSDIYKSVLMGDTAWSAPVNLGPEINTEGNELFPNYIDKTQLLIFTSDGRFGLGGYDIYVASLKVEKYIVPIHLGVPLNSSGDDFGLYLNSDQTAGYVTSNRKNEGKGSDDIYSVTMLKELPNPWKEVKGVAKDNFGRTLSNSKVYVVNENGDYSDSVFSDDEGNYLINLPVNMNFTMEVTKESYTPVINELSTETADNVITLDPVLDHRVIIKGIISNTTKKKPLGGAKVSLYNRDRELIQAVVSEKDGSYLFNVNDVIDYVIVASKGNFFSDSSSVSSEEVNHVLESDIGLVQILPDGVYSVDNEMFLRVRTIYFDYNSSALRADKSVLNEVVKILNDFPNLKIELGSHTDCTGTAEYNQSLSEARAKSSEAYIRARISNPRRIKSVGYGESKLVNNCECEGEEISPCSPQEHQMNRRTEFKIVAK